MATDIKGRGLGELDPVVSLQGTEKILVEDASASKSATLNDVKNFVKEGLPSGNTDYSQLGNKPQIGGKEIKGGNQTAESLGLQENLKGKPIITINGQSVQLGGEVNVAGGEGGGSITIDAELNPESTNAIQNKAVATKLSELDTALTSVSAKRNVVDRYQGGYISTEQPYQVVFHPEQPENYKFVSFPVKRGDIIVYINDVVDVGLKAVAFYDTPDLSNGTMYKGMVVGANRIESPIDGYFAATLEFKTSDERGKVGNYRNQFIYVESIRDKEINNQITKTDEIDRRVYDIRSEIEVYYSSRFATIYKKDISLDGLHVYLNDSKIQGNTKSIRPGIRIETSKGVYEYKNFIEIAPHEYEFDFDKPVFSVWVWYDTPKEDPHFTGSAYINVQSGITLIVTSNTKRIAELEKSPENVKKWRGKRWNVIGDSLTEVNKRTTKHYFDYIAEATGITVINNGKSGTGYANLKDSNLAFYQRIPSMDENFDVITIFGSGNDFSSKLELGTIEDKSDATLCGCINLTIDAIQKKYPTTPLGIITPTPWVSAEPYQNNTRWINYCKAIVDICKNRGIPYLDLYYCSNLHPSDEAFRNLAYTKDDGNGVHPDELGHKIIAPRFYNFVNSLLL